VSQAWLGRWDRGLFVRVTVNRPKCGAEDAAPQLGAKPCNASVTSTATATGTGLPHAHRVGCGMQAPPMACQFN
jgi:hypothetical protein